MNVDIGKKYVYKLTSTKGRPVVGTVVRRLRKEADLVNRHGELIRVPKDRILGAYAYKPKRKVA